MSKQINKNVVVLTSIAAGTIIALASITTSLDWGKAQAEEIAFSAQDYVDIQNLYASYVRATDMGGAGDGSEYADHFTEDGSFNTAKGHEALKKMIKGFHARLEKEGWSSRHTVTGLQITPTPEGANASAYLLTFNITATPPYVDHGGIYTDQLVKTKDGWKYKRRTYRSRESFEPGRP